MTISFRPSEIGEQSDLSSREIKSFDPDRRVDAQHNVDSYEGAFNPDKRVESPDASSANLSETRTTDIRDAETEATLKDYFKDLKAKSEVPETIASEPFKSSDIERKSPEEIKKRREEFVETKSDLRRQWEEKNGVEWPRYDHDVYVNGKLVRRKGDCYDAHHIMPLFAGGDNSVENITPLSVEKHFDHQGVHATNGPCGRLKRQLEAKQND